MSDLATKLLEQALTLPPAEQKHLAEELLGHNEVDDFEDETDTDEFEAMIAERLAAHDANPADALPWPDALKLLREELERRRAAR